jgi:hypothetical protein
MRFVTRLFVSSSPDLNAPAAQNQESFFGGKSPLSHVEIGGAGAHRLLFHHNTPRWPRFDEETMWLWEGHLTSTPQTQ